MKAASVFKSCVGGLLSLALCGCVQSTGLGERAIVKSIYMDFRAGSYEAVLTVMDWKPSADAGSAENQPQVYLGRGKTVGQALQKAEDQQSKKPFYGQNDLLFLGQGILQTDITPCLSYFAQENAVRPNLMVLAVRQNAAQWMEQKEQMGKIVEQSGLMGVKTQGGQEISTSLYEFFRHEGEKASGWMPIVALHDNGLETVTSLAVIGQGKQTAVLQDEQTALALCLAGKSTELTYNGAVDDNILSFIARGVRVVRQAQMKNGTPKLCVMVEGEFQEISMDGKTLYGDKAKQAAAQINRFLEESAKKLSQKTFEQGNDVFAFSWWMAQEDAAAVLRAKEEAELYRADAVDYQFSLSAPKA